MPDRSYALRWLVGPAAAALIWLAPTGLEPAAHRLAGLMAWVVAWWISEPVPLAATGLIGTALLVVLGIADEKKAFSPYAHPLIFLFMGGFFIAQSMMAHGLDRRIALSILSRRWVLGRPWRTIAALLCITAFISMWISNTAATAMMYPIALGVLAAILPGRKREQGAVLIGVAYASSVGGIATPVGSTPNIIAMGMLESLAGERVGFLQWMGFGLPMTVACMAVLLFLTRRSLKGLPDRVEASTVVQEHRALGRLSKGERNTLAAALTAVALWVVPGVLAVFLGQAHAVTRWLDVHVPESQAAMLAAALLFVVPLRSKEGKLGPTLPWREAVKIDWGSLLLFGGGLSLGAALFDTGLASIVGKALVAASGGGTNFWLFMAAVVVFTILLSEPTSNTATASMMIPLAIAAAKDTGLPALIPAIGVTLAASLAFMLPVGTPPNAIVYGSGKITVGQMIRAGAWMDLAAAIIILSGLWILSRMSLA